MAEIESSSTAAAGNTQESSDTVQVLRESFDRATLKLEGAQSLVTMFGIFAGEVDNGSGELPVTGSLISTAMSGIECLIESAVDDLLKGPIAVKATA